MLAYLCLASAMMIVGAYVGFSKLLVAVLPVFLLAWLRFGIAAVAMAHWLPRGAYEPPLDGRSRGLLFLESFLGNFLFSICMLFGMREATAISAGVIMAGIPAAVALLSWLFLRETLSRRMLAAIALAFAAMSPRRSVRWTLVGTAIVLSIAIAISRVWLGVHFPTDVAAGWLGGAGWAFLASALLHRPAEVVAEQADDMLESVTPASRS